MIPRVDERFRREVAEFDFALHVRELRRLRARKRALRLRVPNRATSPAPHGRRSRFHLLQSVRARMRPSHPKTLLKIVETALREAELVSSGDVVLVAVSGGPDSMALLHVMAIWARAGGTGGRPRRRSRAAPASCR